MSQPKKKPRIELAKIKIEPQFDEHQQNDQDKQVDKCSICWIQPPINAIRLDCNHIFCFLCIKSAASSTGRCALCRAEIDVDLEFGEVDVYGEARLPVGSIDQNYWFYEGKSGWWLYDADTNQELEAAYQAGKKGIEKLIAGQVYVISLSQLKQYQKSDQSRSRKICRHTLALDNILGLAGLRNRNLLESIKKTKFSDPETSPEYRY